jgi:hypothetical protein
MAGTAEAKSTSKSKRHHHYYTAREVYPPGPIYYGRGRVAAMDRPIPVNPRSLREPVYVPGNKMNEWHK